MVWKPLISKKDPRTLKKGTGKFDDDPEPRKLLDTTERNWDWGGNFFTNTSRKTGETDMVDKGRSGTDYVDGEEVWLI